MPGFIERVGGDKEIKFLWNLGLFLSATGFPHCSVGQLIKMTEDGRKVNDPHCPN